MVRLVVICAFAVGACAAYGTQQREVGIEATPSPPPTASLIPSDAEALTDAEIHRILAARPTLPPRLRIAIVHLGHDSVDKRYGQNDPGRMIALSPHLVGTLHESEMVKDASYLPAFLVSASPTIAQLREGAARYQADLVLLFSSTCQMYPQFRLFSDSEVRAYCSADSALLDVRTGLVPFVSRSRQDITIAEADTDYRLAETVQRAELEGIDEAMRQNAELLLRFLKEIASKQPAAETESAPLVP